MQLVQCIMTSVVSIQTIVQLPRTFVRFTYNMKLIWSCEWAVTFGTTGRAGWMGCCQQEPGHSSKYSADDHYISRGGQLLHSFK